MGETEFIGYLVGGLAALIGLFVVVGKPIITLSNNITKLNVTIDNLTKNDIAQDAILKQHDSAIVKINTEINKVSALHKRLDNIDDEVEDIKNHLKES